MYIYFGGGYAFVSEHLLYGAQIRPSFQQMRGECVAEGVRTYRLVYVARCALLFYYVEYHYSAESPAAAGEEQRVFVSLFYVQLLAVVHVEAYLFQCALRYGHYALFVSFPFYYYEFLFRLYVRYFEVYKLRHAQTATVHDFYYGFVPAPFGK